MITTGKYQNMMRRRWLDVVQEISALKAEYVSKYAKGDQLNLKFSYRIVFGNMVTEMERLLVKEKVDMVVLNIPEYEQITSEFRGVALQKLLEKIEIPVLTVPGDHGYSPIEKIAYATDLRRVKSSADMLTLVEDLVQRFHSKLHFVHVSKSGKLTDVQDKLTLRLMESKTRLQPEKFCFEVVKSDHPLKAMSEFVKKREIDLVIVIRQTRNFFEAMFHESFSNQISLYSKEPVLILNDRTIFTEDFLLNNN